MISLAQLKRVMPYAKGRADIHHAHLVATMSEFDISTVQRVAAFLAQLSHESGELRYTEEIASGEAYENRLDLGNNQSGDGKRYKGRGFIQLTGRANYRSASSYFGMDFVANPELVSRPEWASRVAGWFWMSNKLNSLADVGDFRAITKLPNGRVFPIPFNTTVGVIVCS